MNDERTDDLDTLLSTMQPELHKGVYAFSSVRPPIDLELLKPIATFQEEEGMTVVTREEIARKVGLKILFRAAWITLTVHSDLHAVGLTAAFSNALGRAGISCNVMAGAYHDHIFVPVESAREALAVLEELQQEATTRMV